MAVHTLTIVNVPSNGQRGPAIQHRATCSCGWVGNVGLPESAQHQYDEHVRTS